VGAPASGKGVREQLLSALLNLGYPRSQAERVVDVAAAEAGEGASIESLIRVALRRLAR
jgi:Holliday junction DNA helicase RuvA